MDTKKIFMPSTSAFSFQEIHPKIFTEEDHTLEYKIGSNLKFCWIIEKAREFQKNIYFCFIDYAKAFDCVDHNKMWKILRDGNTRPSDLFSWETCMQVRKQW